MRTNLCEFNIAISRRKAAISSAMSSRELVSGSLGLILPWVCSAPERCYRFDKMNDTPFFATNRPRNLHFAEVSCS